MTEPKKTESKEDQKTGIVLYCDGSVKPNPGKIGYGIHGFLYSFEVPKKGSGNSDVTITKTGYHANTIPGDKPQAVTPINYYDAFVATQNIASNNVAEMLAVKQGIEIAKEAKASEILIKSDSEYVVKGIKERSARHIRNRWMNDDGTPVKNTMEWKGLLADIASLTETGAKFDINWVRGHSDRSSKAPHLVLGNIIADKLASIGSANSRMGEDKVEVTRTQAEGYWKDKNDKNPLLNHRSLYFNTLSSLQVRGEYMIGNHGKEDDFLGKKDAETSFAVVRLKDPETPIELIREYQSTMTGDYDTICILRMEALYSKNRTADLENYGIACLVQLDHRKIDLVFVDEEPLTKGLTTAKLAMRAIDELGKLQSLLNMFQDKYVDIDTIDEKAPDPFKGYDVTEVTDSFYGKVEKTVKNKTELETKLHDTIVVGHKTLSVPCALGDSIRNIKLVLGHDLPDRNTLKRIEGFNPKLYVLVWKESDQLARYATAIKTDVGYGVWCGVYSNLVVLPKVEG